jgi:hypothetical protein
MPTDKQANLVDHVMYATHDYPCPLRYCGKKAVLNINSGIYGPCTKHEGEFTPPQSKVSIYGLSWYKKIFRRGSE